MPEDVGLSAYDRRDPDGGLAAPGPSILAPLPEYQPDAWQPPSDATIAATQARIADAYDSWVERQGASSLAGLTEWGERGSYPEFTHLMDADDDAANELREEVQRAIAAGD